MPEMFIPSATPAQDLLLGVVVAEKDAAEALSVLQANGEDAYVIGTIVRSDEKIRIC